MNTNDLRGWRLAGWNARARKARRYLENRRLQMRMHDEFLQAAIKRAERSPAPVTNHEQRNVIGGQILGHLITRLEEIHYGQYSIGDFHLVGKFGAISENTETSSISTLYHPDMEGVKNVLIVFSLGTTSGYDRRHSRSARTIFNRIVMPQLSALFTLLHRQVLPGTYEQHDITVTISGNGFTFMLWAYVNREESDD